MLVEKCPNEVGKWLEELLFYAYPAERQLNPVLIHPPTGVCNVSV